MEMNNYAIYKERAREEAICYQEWASSQSLSYYELAGIIDILYKKAKRYGLVKEFRDNGII